MISQNGWVSPHAAPGVSSARWKRWVSWKDAAPVSLSARDAQESFFANPAGRLDVTRHGVLRNAAVRIFRRTLQPSCTRRLIVLVQRIVATYVFRKSMGEPRQRG